MKHSLVMDYIGGNCPVQAEGTIGSKPFYFRARGRRWTFEVGDGDLADIAWVADWVHEEPYGEGPYDAGWMTEEEARSFIRQAAERYLKETQSERE